MLRRNFLRRILYICHFFRKKYLNMIKSILIHEYQHNSTRVNSSQHESTRVRHESTRVRNESRQVNKSKKQVLDESTQVNKSLRIWESITNCRNISRKVFIHDFSFLVQCLHCTWQLRCHHRFLLDMPSFYTSMIFAVDTDLPNSHGFTVCHTVSSPFSRSHSRFLFSHGFTNFFQNSQFS